MEIAKELQFRTCKLCWPTGKSGEQRGGAFFSKGKKEVGRCCLEQKSVGGKLGCSNFLLAGMLLGKKKIFLPPAEVYKVSFFLWGE